jgi:hypothetical protein
MVTRGKESRREAWCFTASRRELFSLQLMTVWTITLYPNLSPQLIAQQAPRHFFGGGLV